MKHTIAAFLLLAGLAAPLSAQDGLRPNGAPITSISPAGPKSESTALLIPLLATATSYLIPGNSGPQFLGVVAFFVGPALGHVYAGNYRRATTGVVIRAGLLGLFFITEDDGCMDCFSPPAAAALLGVLASVVIDIITAPASARAYNTNHARPVITPLAGATGVGVRFTF